MTTRPTPEERIRAAVCVRYLGGKRQYPGDTQNCAGRWDGAPSIFVHPECAVAALEEARAQESPRTER